MWTLEPFSADGYLPCLAVRANVIDSCFFMCNVMVAFSFLLTYPIVYFIHCIAIFCKYVYFKSRLTVLNYEENLVYSPSLHFCRP